MQDPKRAKSVCGTTKKQSGWFLSNGNTHKETFPLLRNSTTQQPKEDGESTNRLVGHLVKVNENVTQSGCLVFVMSFCDHGVNFVLSRRNHVTRSFTNLQRQSLGRLSRFCVIVNNSSLVSRSFTRDATPHLLCMCACANSTSSSNISCTSTYAARVSC